MDSKAERQVLADLNEARVRAARLESSLAVLLDRARTDAGDPDRDERTERLWTYLRDEVHRAMTACQRAEHSASRLRT